MWKQAVGAAALVIAGSMIVYAQQPGNPGAQPAPRVQATPDVVGMGGGRFRPSTQDLSAFADARIAALHAGLQLNADQEKSWPAFEQALREFSKLRIARMSAPRDDQQPSSDPIERLQKRADRMTAHGSALKHLADAAAPLYKSLDDAQKRRFTILARVMRPREGQRGMMWHHRFGGGMDDGRGMRGDGFRRLNDGRGMHRPGGMMNGGDDEDYRGPL